MINLLNLLWQAIESIDGCWQFSQNEFFRCENCWDISPLSVSLVGCGCGWVDGLTWGGWEGMFVVTNGLTGLILKIQIFNKWFSNCSKMKTNKRIIENHTLARRQRQRHEKLKKNRKIHERVSRESLGYSTPSTNSTIRTNRNAKRELMRRQ